MGKLKKVLAMVLCTALLFGVTFVKYDSAEAAGKSPSTLVALGDSITTGYGLVNFNSNDIKNKTDVNNFVTKLSKKLGMKAVNLGVEGIESTQLLKAISAPTTSAQKAAATEIKNAGVVTVSIGGNNVLMPILASINERIGNGKTIYNADASEILMAVFGLLSDQTALEKMQDNALNGALKFTGDVKLKKTGEFALIISQIKKLNPKAQILVQTIYNPYKDILPEAFNTAIESMNSQIITGSANGKNYKVADVYSAFNKATKGTVLVNADSGKSFDPHPTAKGHDVIYTLMAYTAQNKLPYNVKAAITKGSLTTKISAGELIITITPIKGYKVPKTVSVTIGKGAKKALNLKNGAASVPVSDVCADITVTGVCTR